MIAMTWCRDMPTACPLQVGIMKFNGHAVAMSLHRKPYIYVDMNSWLHKMLLVTISVCFFLSATETEFGETRQTFFDQHDTYIKSEQVCFNASIIERLALFQPALVPETLLDHKLAAPDDQIALLLPRSCYDLCRKRYLLNSVLRI